MSNRLLYYITDRSQFPGNESDRRHRLLDKIAEAARCGVDFIQLREKDLPSGDLAALVADALSAIREATESAASDTVSTRLLINSRADIAIAVGAHGVHLRSDDISVSEAREIFTAAAKGAISRVRPRRWIVGASSPYLAEVRPDSENWIVGASCHSLAEVSCAAADGADFVVLAPIFEKTGVQPAGLEALRSARALDIPVLALGGVTIENAATCFAAGAAGIAGIRLFQEHYIANVVKKVRG